jgi:CDP-4-dehydro-6-deoxyglucose reductase
MKAILVSSHEIAPEVRHFVFAAQDVDRLDFTPGQFVSFSDHINGRKVTRAYSIASAPHGNRFELCLNRVREGLFSPHLFSLQPGEGVEMAGPLGYFVPKQPFRDAVFVATGTGVAPFRAFLQSPAVLESGASITLLMGARHEEGLLYRQEFEELAASHPGFRYLPTLTRPGGGWTGRAGRVQAHLGEALAGRTEIDVYICGLKAMVDDVRAILREKGFEKQQVIFEKYD